MAEENAYSIYFLKKVEENSAIYYVFLFCIMRLQELWLLEKKDHD